MAVVPEVDTASAARSRSVTAPTVRRPDIQGLRAVAVLMVVGYHAGLPLPGGFVGVDVFFVISGFVITAMLQREWQAHGRIRFGTFYLRRIKRLTPALALMVSVTVVLSTLFLSPLGAQQTTAQTAVGAMFIVANAVIARTTGDYFDAPAETNALLHTWSLSVEEQFYLVFPVLLAVSWLLARRLRARWVPVAVSAAVAGFSLTVAVLVSRGLEVEQGEMLVGFYGPLTRVWEFAAGALLALAPSLLAPRSRRLSLTQGAVGALLLAASVALISADTPFPGLWTLLPVVGTMLLIRSGGRGDHVIARSLRSTPMVRVGDLSYSIYLWHWPFIVFAAALWPGNPLVVVLAALLSLAPAVVSYVLVEQPLRTTDVRGARQVWRLVSLCVLPPVVLAVLLMAAVDQGLWSPTVRAHQAAVLERHGGCYGYVALTGASAATCTLNSASGAPIYLVGDSHAHHFTEAVQSAGVALGRPVIVSTATSCPVVQIALEHTTATDMHNAGCSSFVRGTLAYLDDAPAGVVVLAASDRYWTDDDFTIGLPGQAMSERTVDKLVTAQAATTATVRRLQDAGHGVLVVEDVPRWDGVDEWSPVDCTVVSLLLPVGSCEKQMPLSRFRERQGAVRDVLRSVAASTGSHTLDLSARMCPNDWCSNHSDGVTSYRDSNHITVAQSTALAVDFTAAIEMADATMRAAVLRTDVGGS